MMALEIKPLCTFHEANSVCSLKFSASGQQLAAATGKSVDLFAAKDGEWRPVLTLKGHDCGVGDVCWSNDSKYICSASDDTTARLWDVAAGKQLMIFDGHESFVSSVSYSPQLSIVASGSFDESIKLWDVRSGKCIRTVLAHSEPISCICFSDNAEMIASSSYDGLCRLWDSRSLECLRECYDKAQLPVTNCQLSPNSRYLLSSSLSSTIAIWDVTTGEQARQFTGHQNTSYSLRCSLCCPKDAPSIVCSGSEDGTVHIWSTADQSQLLKRKVHDAAVLSTAVDLTGRLLATGGGGPDANIHLWTVENS